MEITLGKYRTRDDQTVRIIARYSDSRFIGHLEKDGRTMSWFLDGRFVNFIPATSHPLDLVKRLEERTHTVVQDRFSLMHQPRCTCGWLGGFHRTPSDATGEWNSHKCLETQPPPPIMPPLPSSTPLMTEPPDFDAMAGHPKVETQVDVEATRRMTASEVNSEQQRLLFNQKLDKLVREHRLADERLTEQQLAEAFRQALACGDFQRHVAPQGQSVVYVPFTREQHLQERLDTQSKQLLETVNDRNSLGVQLDLLRDELQRIAARIIESGLQENLHLSRILDYCRRSQKDIEVRYTPIQERDAAQKEVTRLTQRIDSQTREIGRLKNLVAQAFEEGTQNGRALVNPRQWAESRSKRLMEGQL